MSARDKVLAYLSNLKTPEYGYGCMPTGDIARAIGLQRETVRRACWKLQKAGVIAIAAGGPGDRCIDQIYWYYIDTAGQTVQ